MVEVAVHAPGGTSPAHIHPKSAFIYATMLEGAIRSQVSDGPVPPTTLARASPRILAIVTPSAQTPAPPRPHAFSPSSSSTPTRRTWRHSSGTEGGKLASDGRPVVNHGRGQRLDRGGALISAAVLRPRSGDHA